MPFLPIALAGRSRSCVTLYPTYVSLLVRCARRCLDGLDIFARLDTDLPLCPCLAFDSLDSRSLWTRDLSVLIGWMVEASSSVTFFGRSASVIRALLGVFSLHLA